jgi:hypothetical protein
MNRYITDEDYLKQMVHRKNGYLYWGQQKMTEYDDGVFFLFDGWEVNFNENPPRIGHYKLTRIK